MNHLRLMTFGLMARACFSANEPGAAAPNKLNFGAKTQADPAAAAQDGQAGANTSDSIKEIVGDGVNNLQAQAGGDSEQAQIQQVLNESNDAGAPLRTGLSMETATGEPQVGLIGARANTGDADIEVITGDALAGALDAQLESLDESIDETGVLYSSHPVGRLTLGKYEFTNSQLRVEDADVAEFEELLEQQPVYIRNMIRKIDVDAANEMIRGRIQAMRAGIDTTAGSLTPGGVDGKL